MWPLAAAAAKHNAADDEAKTEQQRDDVAETREGRRRVGGRREYCVNRARSAPRQRLHDIAAPVDHGADPGRSRTNDWQALLGGAESGLGQVLRRAPASKPGVVRRVEDKGGAVPFVDHMARENDLVTQLKPDLAPLAADIDRSRSRTG